MPHYVLRNVDQELWTQARTRARTIDGRPIRHVLLDLLRYYVEHGLPPQVFRRVDQHEEESKS